MCGTTYSSLQSSNTLNYRRMITHRASESVYCTTKCFSGVAGWGVQGSGPPWAARGIHAKRKNLALIFLVRDGRGLGSRWWRTCPDSSWTFKPAYAADTDNGLGHLTKLTTSKGAGTYDWIRKFSNRPIPSESNRIGWPIPFESRSFAGP